jgi:large subunit ribosomal protein L24
VPKVPSKKYLRTENKVIVAGVNIKKKVIKARVRGEKHTLVEKAYPIHISSVSLIDPSIRKTNSSRYPCKMGAKKVRVARKSGKDIA